MKRVSKDDQARIHLIVGLAKFTTEHRPYSDVKKDIKTALYTAQSYGLKSVIAHNLAVVNYCEVQDHNERAQTDGLG